MALLDHFRRRAIRDHATAGAFIDEQAFHIAESCVRDYSRLRAGDGADALLADPAFAAALDKACWEAYPRALVMVGTVAEVALRPYAGDNAHPMLFGLIALILDHFDQRPVPRAIGDVEWRAARADIERALNDLVRAQPKTAEAVARDHSSFYLAIMPLHPKLGADDFAALGSQLKLALLQIQEAFGQRANLPALANALAGRVPKVEAHEAPSAPA
ncbi:MAG TPA: hypothetical protein VFB68_15845 [Xanthobacteraceae bacterium]|nr:hypothetical protein [Xanthobacteraceae bacterium]